MSACYSKGYSCSKNPSKEHVKTRYELQLQVNMFLTILSFSLLAAEPSCSLGLVQLGLHTADHGEG